MSTKITYHDKRSDDHGRSRFTLEWEATYHPGHPLGEHRKATRGQCFHADPQRYGHPRPEAALAAAEAPG